VEVVVAEVVVAPVLEVLAAVLVVVEKPEVAEFAKLGIDCIQVDLLAECLQLEIDYFHADYSQWLCQGHFQMVVTVFQRFAEAYKFLAAGRLTVLDKCNQFPFDKLE